jgi:hypothetical protein
MPAEPELVAESGAERADDRDVHGEVDQHDRQAADPGQVPERGHATVDIRQRQPDHQRDHRYASDRHDGGPAAGQPGERRGKNPFAPHREQDPDGR